ncbi:MAG: HAMP domain-containing histidine kinase, partial [Chlorobi bacterium]|nr:HAMP domain-containing histidine kinase [Chlorobiota bacterium]
TVLFLFFFVFLASFGFISQTFLSNFHFATLIFYLILFSFFTSYVIFDASNFKEKEDRKIIAMNLASERDYVAEFGFGEIAQKIEKDTLLFDLLSAYPFADKQDYDKTVIYIVDTYFSDYWSKYEFLITICDSSRNLEMEEDNMIINCADYFNETKSEFGKKTQSPQLTFLDFKLANDYYLGIISPKFNPRLSIYFEIFSKHTPRGLGYPELLIDKKVLKASGLQNYSWARYEQNELVYHVGKYFYSTNLENYGKLDSTMGFFNRNGFNHLYSKSDEDTTYLISIVQPGILEILTPFSYIFIFYSVLLIILLLIFNKPRFNQFSKLNFRKRLQITIVSLIVASFVLVGAGSLYYIISLNNDKNHTIISEKAQSVLIELEHKLATKNTLTVDMEPYLSEILYKFSLVFFSDLNLYDLNGSLLATSRPEVFNKGLIASKINPEAYDYMAVLKKSFYIHKEKIGNYEYYSAYVPFRNENNKLIAYLNLPYFAKQSELTNEISTFLVAFVNIYVIFIAIAVFIALLISNYITKPVLLIKEKIGKVRLGKTNEKILWEKDDEIGSLVTEYNRMIDELAASAQLLAKSERESAWREMAKQIAHEIKNPLTPMKLSVQYLQKTWDEKAPDWDRRLKHFTQTIVEQIDSLSIIATEFSDFAKMPKSRFERVELTAIITNSLRLFKRSSKVQMHTDFQKQHYIRADKEQFLRVFNNLVKNSIQAFTETEEGRIDVRVEEKEGKHIIRFSDNGSGIPADQREKVFSPNFTTKTGGMGLGLAMVKSIVQNAGGEISFTSEEGAGTTFTIILPVYED